MDTMKFSVIMNQHPQDTNKVLKLHYYVNEFIIAGDRNKVNYINYYIIPDDYFGSVFTRIFALEIRYQP
jgi:hypothetical protein